MVRWKTVKPKRVAAVCRQPPSSFKVVVISVFQSTEPSVDDPFHLGSAGEQDFPEPEGPMMATNRSLLDV